MAGTADQIGDAGFPLEDDRLVFGLRPECAAIVCGQGTDHSAADSHFYATLQAGNDYAAQRCCGQRP
jgi:hypothetical protein